MLVEPRGELSDRYLEMLLLCLLQFLRILVTLFLNIFLLSVCLLSDSLGQLVKSGQIFFVGSV